MWNPWDEDEEPSTTKAITGIIIFILLVVLLGTIGVSI